MSPSHKLSFRPIDPESALDFSELQAQRRACGWNEHEIPEYMQAIERGDMLYYLIYLDDGQDKESVIGSGAIDLAGTSEPTLSSRERSEFCVMGLYLYPEFRGRGLSKQIARHLIDYGFETLNQQSSGVMTLQQNPVTNYMFKDFGYTEFFREPKPEWLTPGAYGVSYRLTRDQWLSQRQSREPSISDAQD